MIAAHEKGRCADRERPLTVFPMSSTGCQTGITCQHPDGDAVNVSRAAPERKFAVSIDSQEHGDEHLTCHG
jgi:hypothetical protein